MSAPEKVAGDMAPSIVSVALLRLTVPVPVRAPTVWLFAFRSNVALVEARASDWLFSTLAAPPFSVPSFTVTVPEKLFVEFARVRVPVPVFVKLVPVSWPCAVSVWEPATSIRAVAPTNVIVRCVTTSLVTMPRAPDALIVTALPESPSAASVLMASRPLFRMMPDVATKSLVPVRVWVFPLSLIRPPVPVMLPENVCGVASPRIVRVPPFRLTVPEPERPPTVWSNELRSSWAVPVLRLTDWLFRTLAAPACRVPSLTDMPPLTLFDVFERLSVPAPVLSRPAAPVTWPVIASVPSATLIVSAMAPVLIVALMVLVTPVPGTWVIAVFTVSTAAGSPLRL